MLVARDSRERKKGGKEGIIPSSPPFSLLPSETFVNGRLKGEAVWKEKKRKGRGNWTP